MVATYFCGAKLYASIKKDDTFRPVAVGNILRHLTSKVLTYAVGPRMASYLRPLQFGVGIRSGSDRG